MLIYFPFSWSLLIHLSLTIPNNKKTCGNHHSYKFKPYSVSQGCVSIVIPHLAAYVAFIGHVCYNSPLEDWKFFDFIRTYYHRWYCFLLRYVIEEMHTYSMLEHIVQPARRSFGFVMVSRPVQVGSFNRSSIVPSLRLRFMFGPAFAIVMYVVYQPIK